MIQRGKSSCGTEFYFQKIHTLFNCFVLAMSTHRCYSLRTTATSVWTACMCVCVCVCVLQVRYHSDISFTSPSPFDFLCIALPGKLTYSLFFCFFVLFFSPPWLFFFFFCAICPFVRNRSEKGTRSRALDDWSGVTSVTERHVMEPVLDWSLATRIYRTFIDTD